MTEIELRYNLLTDARNHLIRGWEEKVAAEKAVAAFENRPFRIINPPTPRRIMKMASELYEFVPPSEPATPAAS